MVGGIALSRNHRYPLPAPGVSARDKPIAPSRGWFRVHVLAPGLRRGWRPSLAQHL
jgi:hypothetical protein